MQWGSVGAIGALFLAAYLIIVGVSLIAGLGASIPGWFVGIVAAAAGILILVGK